MNKPPFSEAAYFAAYKAIRNQLRRYDPALLIGICLRYLHQPVKQPFEYIQRQPWCVLLLIKWTLVDEQFADRGRPAPSEAQMVAMLQQVLDLGGMVRMPSEHDHPALFMRVMAFQQFWFQRRASVLLMGRQLLYFGSLDGAHYIPRTFHAMTGMPLSRFLQLGLAMQTAFMDSSPARFRIGPHWFSTLQGEYTVTEVDAFLRLLSKPLGDMRHALLVRDRETRKNNRLPRVASEYTEQSPFMHAPLVPEGNEYVCVAPHLLDRCLGQLVYNRLRAYDVNVFMSHFGPVFEDYVRRAVEHLGLPYRSERDVKELFRNKPNHNLIDFLIADGDAHVYVDAKAAEMNYRGTVTHDAGELADLLKTSLLSAIKQAHSVLHDLHQLTSSHPVFQPRSSNYLLVVTYCEMYIGNGRALAEAVGDQAIEAILTAYPTQHHIPLENMYFLTIEEFEQLSAAVRVGNIGLIEALERAKACDADPRTRSLIFEQHLSAWGLSGTAPDYVIAKTTEALEQLASHLKE